MRQSIRGDTLIIENEQIVDQLWRNEEKFQWFDVKFEVKQWRSIKDNKVIEDDEVRVWEQRVENEDWGGGKEIKENDEGEGEGLEK